METAGSNRFLPADALRGDVRRVRAAAAGTGGAQEPPVPGRAGLRFCYRAAASSARPPARMPSIPRLPSWQAYSYITSDESENGYETVQDRVYI